MSSSTAEIQRVAHQFKASINAGKLEEAKQLLTALKLKLITLPSLPPTLEDGPHAREELSLARDVLEHALLLAVRLEDEEAFERNFHQLQPYYTDVGGRLPPSEREALLTGLNLLRLLVENRIAEFHTELEVIPLKAQQSRYIAQAVQLEQWLMEGAYNKVLEARGHVPDPSYAHFLERLLTTVRDEVAGCSERAYGELRVPDARALLLFSADEEALHFAQERGWAVKDGRVTFQSAAEEQEAAQKLPAMDIISYSLSYANELERIV